jgi:ferredoxin
MTEKGIEADLKTYQVGSSNIFVAGSALKRSRMAIRAHGQGKEVAFSVHQFLKKEEVTGEPKRFNSRFGKLRDGEIAEYLKESVEEKRLQPHNEQSGFSVRQVILEASRCMQCDCRDLENCKLRRYSDEYKAVQSRFKSPERKPIIKHFQHDTVINEPSKCIRCGICVKICAENREAFGLSFIGRGFDSEVGVPFNEDLKEGLKKMAEEVVHSCPVGALVWKERS